MSSLTFEKDGSLTPPTEAEIAQADIHAAILSYTSGKLADGTPYYAYIAVKPSLYAKFRTVTASGQPFVLGEYGAIITAGFEEQAPVEVAKEMRLKYGFDEEYEYKLVQIARQQQAEFVKEEEEKRMSGIIAMLKSQTGSSQAG